MIASSKRAFVADSGLMFKPQETFQNAPPSDTLIVSGGVGLGDSDICTFVSAFIKKQAGRTRRIVSVCTGIYALASTAPFAVRSSAGWELIQAITGDVCKSYHRLSGVAS